MKVALDARSQPVVEAWLAQWLADEMGLQAAVLEPGKSFLSYGMNSVDAIRLVGDIEERLGFRLPPTLVWDYPSPDALACFVVEKAREASANSQHERGTPDGAAMPPAPDDAAALLARLDRMSEEEMDSLLQNYLQPSR
jgi:acyl carrier protein